MKNTTTVLIAGRSKTGIEALEAQLEGQPGVTVRTRHAANGHTDPLHGVNPLPDVLLLDLSALWQEELNALTERSGATRLPLIAVGAEGDIRMMRMAMQAGARDFFTHPVPTAELLQTLQQIAEEAASSGARTASLTAVMNAKGGSGGSFLACNLAHILAAHLGKRTALIDMDIQFGTLPLYLDLSPRDGLVEALASADTLDSVALRGYMTRHASGLHLLASRHEQLSSSWGLSANGLSRLLDIATGGYDHLIADLPRQIDPLTTTVIERADRIVLVMEQSLAHLRDAKSLLKIITSQLAVPSDRVHVVVNRHDPKSAVSINDIKETLRSEELFILPNDFKRVTESINMGVPMYQGARNAAVTKSLVKLAVRLSGVPKGRGKGLFGSLSSLFRSQAHHKAEQ